MAENEVNPPEIFTIRQVAKIPNVYPIHKDMTKRDLSISHKSKRSEFPNDSWENWPFEEKVRLFQEQIQGWVIDVARDIKQKQIAHADFAILSILLAYFENISKFINGYDGKYESKNHFVRGIRQIYPRKATKKEYRAALRPSEKRYVSYWTNRLEN